MATSNYKDVVLIEDPSKEDCSVVMVLLVNYIQQGMEQGNPVGKLINLERCFDYVQILKDSGRLNVFKDKTGRVIGAIAFNKCDLWFSLSSCICEEFVLSCPSFSGFGRIALDRLNDLADLYGCEAIVSGNLLSPYDKRVENLYMRKGGFDLKVNQFIKVF